MPYVILFTSRAFVCNIRFARFICSTDSLAVCFYRIFILNFRFTILLINMSMWMFIPFFRRIENNIKRRCYIFNCSYKIDDVI